MVLGPVGTRLAMATQQLVLCDLRWREDGVLVDVSLQVHLANLPLKLANFGHDDRQAFGRHRLGHKQLVQRTFFFDQLLTKAL